MGFKVPQHWGILGAKISIHDRAKYNTVNYTLAANLENLFLQGTAINGTGNELNNSITGNAILGTVMD
jgi:hypothetical protein